MISRSLSAPTADAMSIECTTSANNTVTCLYSAVAATTGAPHSKQNFAVAPSCVPHDAQHRSTSVIRVRPSPRSSTSIWCHRWSGNVSDIGQCVDLLQVVLKRVVDESGRECRGAARGQGLECFHGRLWLPHRIERFLGGH